MTHHCRPIALASVLAVALVLLAQVGGPIIAISLADSSEPEAESAISTETAILQRTAEALGWLPAVDERRLAQSGLDSEVFVMLWPPRDYVRYGGRTVYTITNSGSYDEETIQYVRILDLGSGGGQRYIDKLVENGFVHTSYQGRETALVRNGQQLCNVKGLVGRIQTIVNELSGEEDAECIESDAGIIAWACGDFVFTVRDDTESGLEHELADALYQAAENEALCGWGDTLVVLVDTDDQQGSKKVDYFQAITREANVYYGHNAYGQVVPSYTFLDADGDSGDDDWYHLEADLSAYQGKEYEFRRDALGKVFKDGLHEDEVSIERVIIVHGGEPGTATGSLGGPLTCCATDDGYDYSEYKVGPDGDQDTLRVRSEIIVAETYLMGTWAHEIGHSLRGRSGSDGKARYVRDRYNYADPSGQHGDIDHWGLMGKGCHWGEPLGSAPTHMCGLTKYSAGWLGLEDAKLGKSSDLVALERMSAGDDLLRVDDPTTRDPRSFYLVEARDAAEPYGAPEAGVVVYKVSWAKDHRHYVVNALEAPVGATRAEGANGYWALRPTLRGAAQSGSPSRLSIPAAKLAIALSSVSSEGGYAAVVIADTYTPTHLMGAVLAPRGKSAVPAPEGQGPKGDVFVAGSGPPLPLPDIDLHAYDEQGRHVGLNYETHQYERLIPGAQASGDLKDDAEWIYAPEGTAVSYQVRTDKTAQFLANNPQYADTVRPQSYEVTYHKIDAEGAITQARGEKSKLEAGESDDLKGPDGKRLRYRTMRVPGYGRNWPEDWGQAISIMLIILLGVSGWVVTVLRWWQAKAA